MSHSGRKKAAISPDRILQPLAAPRDGEEVTDHHHIEIKTKLTRMQTVSFFAESVGTASASSFTDSVGTGAGGAKSGRRWKERSQKGSRRQKNLRHCLVSQTGLL